MLDPGRASWPSATTRSAWCPFGEYVPLQSVLSAAGRGQAGPAAWGSSRRATTWRSAPPTAIASPSSSATRPSSPTWCAASRSAAPTCSSTSRTTAGTAARPRRTSTWPWPPSARWRTGSTSCAPPTPASPRWWTPRGRVLRKTSLFETHGAGRGRGHRARPDALRAPRRRVRLGLPGRRAGAHGEPAGPPPLSPARRGGAGVSLFRFKMAA